MSTTPNPMIVGDTPLPGVYGYDMVYGVTQDIVNFQFKVWFSLFSAAHLAHLHNSQFLHATYIPGTKTTYIPQTIDTRTKPGGPGLWGALGAP